MKTINYIFICLLSFVFVGCNNNPTDFEICDGLKRSEFVQKDLFEIWLTIDEIEAIKAIE
ncbi:MAG: hypothetical protein OSJ55_05575 [Bacteroidales bacterium]|nr:hypothetical protein [Bacteroidales bacterium]